MTGRLIITGEQWHDRYAGNAVAGSRWKDFIVSCVAKDWNVHFKLHATGQTTVEATLKEGAVVSLTVQPKEREKDVVNCLLNK